jgi:tetratricopeptide (TPR) repeat protein
MTTPVLSTTPTGQMLGLLSELSFTQLVNDALRNYQSTLALSRSPLANSPLVTPTLVKDEASPTAEERGHGLRLVLQWAVNQLAPGVPESPLGDYRPLDDPTWRDPLWWRYNILRHRYLEPLHPDDFIGGGRYTESLLALTGISSADAFFDERNRAIRTVAERLRQQLIDSQASAELQRLALQEALLPLEKQPEAARLLGIAATFDDIFPRSLLQTMAEEEAIVKPTSLLDALIGPRFLLTGDEGASLWLAPLLRLYVYERQPKTASQRRHRLIAAYYEAEHDHLPAARHWQRAGQDARAVRVLLPVAEELIHELQIKELIEFFQQIDARQLPTEQQYTVHLLVSDLFQRSGQQEEALAACRQAIQATNEPGKQARVYRRMGKLYESRNQLHALRYYQQAAERFAPTDPELAELLKDRGWLHCLRKEWSQAEANLQQALEVVATDAQGLRADIYDAMASLNRERGRHAQALHYAEQALAIREETGDLMRVAKSLGNLGLLYRVMGEYGPATAAHTEAMSIYQKLGNQELTAVAWLNIGAAHFINHRLDDAIAAYQQSLTIGQSISLPLIELKAHYNLAEALGAATRAAEALHHWEAGYQLCRQHNFDDQEADFLALRTTLHLPTTNGMTNGATNNTHPPTQPTNAVFPWLDADEQAVVALVQAERTLTAKRLMDATAISRATATRRLTALVERGVLAVEGKGRGTYYYLAEQTPPAPVATGDEPDRASIATTLQPHQADLLQRYGVTALGLLSQEKSGPLLPFIVCFATMPTLPVYRHLKRHLTQLLHCELDLLLEEEAPTTALCWLWRTEE